MRITQATFSDLANSRNTTIIKRWLVQFLEHGTIPAVVLALAIAPTDSRIRKRHDFTQSTNRGMEILFPALAKDGMTLASQDYERHRSFGQGSTSAARAHDLNSRRPILIPAQPSHHNITVITEPHWGKCL